MRRQKLMNDGNFKEAYDGFSALALDPADDPAQVGDDLTQRRPVPAATQPRGRSSTPSSRRSSSPTRTTGCCCSPRRKTTSCRGPSRLDRGGQFRPRPASRRHGEVRQRLRARPRPRAAAHGPGDGRGEGRERWAAGSTSALANMLLGNRGYGDAWRLQYLTDLDKLPDYEEGYYYGGGRGIGAPVNADGTPVYHHAARRAGRPRRPTASAGAGRSTRPPRSPRR